MEKKESPKPETNFDFRSKMGGFSIRLFSITKFILGVCLLPFVYSESLAFLNEFNQIEAPFRNYFWSGIISLLIIYLFVWEPTIIYIKGQKILEKIFRFFTPLVKVAPYLLPIYTLILFILYWVLAYKFKDSINFFVFLFGFSIALHFIFSAKSLRSKQEDFLKANYIFGFAFIYIINLILLAFGLNLIFEKFSFVNFFNQSFQIAKSIFYAAFKQLFL